MPPWNDPSSDGSSGPGLDDVQGTWTPRFPIVGIGASAGGLEALEALTKRLAADGMAYVVLQHLAPGHESVLAEILSRDTPIRVVTIQDGVEIEVNVIYVTPPNANVSIERGVLHLVTPSEATRRNAIDAFFRSLAADQGTAAIGVVLSGAGSDGTLGLRAIKDAGGITFAQAPGSASQPSMPLSAVDAGVADFCLPPAEIGDELMRLGAHPFIAKQRPTPMFSGEAFQQIFTRLKTGFGVDFSGYKQTTIERRISRRMALQKVEKVEDYIKLLDASPAELNALYGDVLIGVTTFFRDSEPFEYLKQIVFPRLLESRSSDQPIRIWVAGCATGEEAYSVAICLLEVLGDRAPTYRIQIFASDIDDESLATARLGVYPSSIDLDVSAERLQRFFVRAEHGYQVTRQVRDLVVFARHNLGKDPPFSRLDLISCRNVLIYMQVALQRRVLRVFHYALKPDAFLLLGTSESVGDAADMFSIVDRSLKIYQKKNVASTAVFDFALGRVVEAEPARALPTSPADHRLVVTVQQLADRKAIEKYAPPGVLLNEDLEVIQFRGQTGPFLAPTPGTATFNVFKLARPELLIELRATIHKAVTEGAPRSSAEIPPWDPERGALTIDVVPVHDASAGRKCLLVAFREAARPPTSGAVVEEPATELHGDARIAELERTLTTTEDYLQATVHDLEAVNDDLQVSNEELQSSNEELQSTNEELETSKEELQSTNEELATVNDELHNRMAQLATSNDDLQNLLAQLSSVVVLVGADLRLRRFSASAEKVLNLIANDVGRPISYLDNVLRPAQVESAIADAINTLATREARVRTAEGTWFTLRASPYRTAEHAIRGAMVELTRMPIGRKGDGFDPSDLEARVLSGLPFPLALLDAQLRIVYANKRFFEKLPFGAEILGAPLDEVWSEHGGQDPFWQALQATTATGLAFQNLRVPHPFGHAELPDLWCNGYRIIVDPDRPALTLLLMLEAPITG